MKKTLWLAPLLFLSGLALFAQKGKPVSPPALRNSLLWKIDGNGLDKPSYLFGTMHMLCADDITLSDSLKGAIAQADDVYLELDMDNMFEMLGAMQHMNMRGDTTLADLLTKDEFNKVKMYFQQKSVLMPFEMLQSFKPLLTASMLAEQQSATCDHMISMEQLVMAEAKKESVDIRGLETMDFQLGIFDKIPYKLQARQLYQLVAHAGEKAADDELEVLTNAYRRQELEKLEEMTRKEDMGLKNFTDILLYNRNKDWSEKLQALMPGKSLVVAVGAGHLPGTKGVISLLRKAGYRVEPVANDMIKQKVKVI